MLATAALAGCQPDKTPAERARDDARAVAMVEAAQARNPPPVPLDPEPITAQDIAAGQLEPACRFTGAGAANGLPVLLVNDRRALIKLEARFIGFAVDPGSPLIAPGIRAHFVGKAQSLVLERAPPEPAQAGTGLSLRWPARATVRDAWDQLVFAASGEVVCPG